MTVSGGNPIIFLHSNVAQVLVALSVLAFALPLLWPLLSRLIRRPQPAHQP
jgi:hypothetical protein